MSWGLGSKFKERRKGLNVSDSKKQRKKNPAHICWRQNELEQGQRNVREQDLVPSLGLNPKSIYSYMSQVFLGESLNLT